MEASTGIEPVYTDLQSNRFHHENNALASEKYQDKAGTAGEHDTRPQKARNTFSQLIKDRHKRAARALGYALTLGTKECWSTTAMIWEARLSPEERYELARSVLLAMPPEDAEALAADALGGAGYPLPPFLAPLEDAQWWADLANRAELRAYCLAAFMAMSKRDRREFLDFARGAEA